jgi:hypothetical protein
VAAGADGELTLPRVDLVAGDEQEDGERDVLGGCGGDDARCVGLVLLERSVGG